MRFDYQLDWHCSKTDIVFERHRSLFDYQLDWHCSKTVEMAVGAILGHGLSFLFRPLFLLVAILFG